MSVAQPAVVGASELPFVSAVIPCRDEEKFLGACLESLIHNDYPRNRLEILVVDGASADATQDVARRFAERYPWVRLLDNPRGIIPAGMNVGIRAARGDVIMKIDAHSVYPSDYISRCVRFQSEYNADNVGGVVAAVPSVDTAVARAIALALSHPFGSGNSRFRIGASRPCWADTVAFGCYKREVFERIGMYDERLVRSSDMDLNTRLRRAGGRILLVPDIVIQYFPRAGLGDFFKRNVLDGFWALYPLRFGGQVARMRHVVPLMCLLAFGGLAAASWFSRAAGLSLATLVFAYAAMNIGFSLRTARKEGRRRVAAVLPLVFALRHLGYAVGSLWGWVRALGSVDFWARRQGGPA